MRNIIVTGGATGIGKQIVSDLAREGYNVVLIYNKSEDEAVRISEELENEGIKIYIYKTDITNRQQVNDMVSYVVETLGSVDVLINNAGKSQIKLFTEISQIEWNDMVNTNLTGTFNVTQEVLKQSMINNKKGLIINMSSIWGINGASCEVHYSATKAGIDGMTRSLARELGLSNIRVNSIAPGIIDTKMNNHLTESEKQAIINEIPLNRMGTPEHITKCIKWLIADNYTTGQVISIDGGWSI